MLLRHSNGFDTLSDLAENNARPEKDTSGNPDRPRLRPWYGSVRERLGATLNADRPELISRGPRPIRRGGRSGRCRNLYRWLG